MKGSIIHLHSSSFSFISRNKRPYFLGASFGAVITYRTCYRSRIGEENVFLPFSMNHRGAYSHFLHYWQKLYLRCLAALVGEKHFIPATLFPEAAALLHGARLFSLSLSFISYSNTAMERSCVSQRVPWFWFSSVIVYTLFHWGVLLIMFLPYDRTVLEHDAGMLQWNMQLVLCKSIFSIFYHHRLFNKIDFTGRSILWPVIYKYTCEREIFAQ